MNAATLQAKTEVAAASAQALLERGDPDGTVNRALELRQLADYTGESIDMAEAAELVEQARRFVQAVRQALPETGKA